MKGLLQGSLNVRAYVSPERRFLTRFDLIFVTDNPDYRELPDASLGPPNASDFNTALPSVAATPTTGPGGVYPITGLPGRGLTSSLRRVTRTPPRRSRRR